MIRSRPPLAPKGPEKPIDELRGAYDQFVNSPVGKDFLTKVVAYETSLVIQAYADNNPETQAKNINKAAGIYWVRTLLQDLSTPKTTVSGRSGTTPPLKSSVDN